MSEISHFLYISNIMKSNKSIQSYSLFGESMHLPDVLHCETIAERSVLHDWEVAPHRHVRLHQILLISSGSGEVNIDGVAMPLAAGALVNIPQGCVHAFRFEPETRGWVTTFADELLDDLFKHVGDVRRSLERACVIKADSSIELTVEQIWQEFSSQSKARALVLRGLSAVLMGWVSRAMQADEPERQVRADSILVQRFVELIELHFLEHWQVRDYAEALSISTTHLSRLTRATTGHSALRLIEARLMREARRNLAYTNLSVSTIAYSLGYTDPAYFTRAFKRDSGLSPRAFRIKV